MQNLKDTFYLQLRDRIAAINPGRTIVVRGALRPGVLVSENELPAGEAAPIPDAFCLTWSGLAVEPAPALPLTAMRCEIAYTTDGTAGNAGMDRGRLLTAMDAELQAALGPTQPQSGSQSRSQSRPQSTPKITVVDGQPIAADGTSIFWSDVAFGPQQLVGERALRTASVEVFGYGQ